MIDEKILVFLAVVASIVQLKSANVKGEGGEEEVGDTPEQQERKRQERRKDYMSEEERDAYEAAETERFQAEQAHYKEVKKKASNARKAKAQEEELERKAEIMKKKAAEELYNATVENNISQGKLVKHSDARIVATPPPVDDVKAATNFAVINTFQNAFSYVTSGASGAPKGLVHDEP